MKKHNYALQNADIRPRLKIRTQNLSLAESDDSEAGDSIFKTGHLMSRNLVN